MRFVRRLAVVVLVAATALPAGAVLCRKKNGAVFERDACKRKETPLDPATIGAVGAPGEAGTAGTTQPRLRIVDGMGRQLPGAISASGELVLTTADRVAGLQVGRDGVINDTFVYESIDCSGQTLLRVSVGELYDGAAVVGGSLLYGGGPTTTVNVQSRRFASEASACTGLGFAYDPVSGTCCEQLSPFDVPTAVATPLPFDFVPPFTVTLEE